jgi:hypothetical protein
MSEGERLRLQTKMRGLMAKTMANGCTDEEELAAARMVGRLVEQLDALPGGSPAAQASWAANERASPQYQALLEKNILESLLKSTVQELALEHINTVSPPRRDLRGVPVERVLTPDLVEPYLAMMLGVGGARSARDILARLIEELIIDGMLPQAVSIPRE